MSDLLTIPLQDDYQTTLQSTWSGGTGSVTVNSVPTATMPSGKYSYIVVNPGESNMQVAKIDWWNSGAKTFNVTSIAVRKGASIDYTTQSHAAGAVVRFSNNYAFWEDIMTAVNSKADTTALIDKFGNVTITNSEIKATGDMTLKDDNNPAITLSQLASGSGADQKVAITNNDTTTGTLNDKLLVGSGLTKTVVNPGASETMRLYPDTNILATKTYVDNSNLALKPQYTIWFGDGRDGDVTITTSVSLSSDMFYNNLTVTSPGVLNPNGYKIYVKWTLSGNGTIQFNGNNGGNGNTASSTPWTAWTIINAGTLNAWVAGVAGWSGTGNGTAGEGTNGVASNPSYVNITSTAGGNWANGTIGFGNTGWTSAISTRWSFYNRVLSIVDILCLIINPASTNSSLTWLRWTTTQYKVAASWGGWGGWGGNITSIGWSGGWSGSSAGIIWISANIVNFTGTINSIGGTGGNGWNWIVGQSWSGWGGAGGSGGILYLIYHTLTSKGTVNLTGWTGWIAGTVGVNLWTAGNNWTNGVEILVNI